MVASGIRTSGPVDCFYFKNVHFREPSGILFEVATDEPLEHLGETHALSPFLAPRRAEIEARLKPI